MLPHLHLSQTHHHYYTLSIQQHTADANYTLKIQMSRIDPNLEVVLPAIQITKFLGRNNLELRWSF